MFTNCLSVLGGCDTNRCRRGECEGDPHDYSNWKCNCPPGYEGLTCSIETNECEYTTCQNGGTCHDHVARFSCACAAGYTGITCENGENKGNVMSPMLKS